MRMAAQNNVSNRFPSILSFVVAFLFMLLLFNFWIGTKEDWLISIREPSFVIKRIVTTFLLGLIVCFLLEFMILRLLSFCGFRNFGALGAVTKVIVVLIEALVVSIISL